MEKKEAFKKGNTFFVNLEYEKAISFYQQSLSEDNGNEMNSVIHSNLSACFLNLDNSKESLFHANKSIELNPSRWKGYNRKIESIKKLNDEEKQIQNEICKVLSEITKNKIDFPEDKLEELKETYEFFKSEAFANSINKRFEKYVVIDSKGRGNFSNIGEILTNVCSNFSLGIVDNFSIILMDKVNVVSKMFTINNREIEFIGVNKDTIIRNVGLPFVVPMFYFHSCQIFFSNISIVFDFQIPINRALNPIIVLDSQVSFKNCVLKSPKYPLIFPGDSVLTFEDCKIQDCRAFMISTICTICLKNCILENIKNTCFELRDFNQFSMENCKISNTGKVILSLYNSQNSISVKDCDFKNSGNENEHLVALKINRPNTLFTLEGGIFVMDKCSFKNCVPRVSKDGKGSFVPRSSMLLFTRLKFAIMNCDFFGDRKSVCLNTNECEGLLDKNKVTEFKFGSIFVFCDKKKITMRENKFSHNFIDVLGDSDLKSIKSINQGRLETREQKMFRTNQRPDVKKRDHSMFCSYCGIQKDDADEKFKKCSRCKSEFYCSRECQMKHWKLHKYFCKAQ